jgi:hypothetical protein
LTTIVLIGIVNCDAFWESPKYRTNLILLILR